CIASISVRYSRSVTGTPAALSSVKKVTNILRPRVAKRRFGPISPAVKTSERAQGPFLGAPNMIKHIQASGAGGESGIEYAGGQKLHCRGCGNAHPACARALERLSASAIRQRRLHCALVRGHAGREPLDRLRPVSQSAHVPGFLAGSDRAGG